MFTVFTWYIVGSGTLHVHRIMVALLQFFDTLAAPRCCPNQGKANVKLYNKQLQGCKIKLFYT